MQNHFEAYLASCFRDKRSTRRMRLHWLHEFARFCNKQNLTLSQITSADIDKYRQQLTWVPGARGPLSASSIHNGLVAVRALLRWAVAQGLLSPDPTVGWILPAPTIREKKIMNRDQLEQALYQVTGLDPLDLRNRALLWVATELGFSTVLCCKLELSHLDLSRYQLLRKPMSAQFLEIMQGYLHKGRPALLTDPEETKLFLTRVGTRMHTQSVNRVLQACGGGNADTLHRSWKAHRESILGRRLTDS